MTTRVLIADDDPTVCLLAKAALRQEGCSVSTVDNGKAALSACAEESFQLALLDVEMPGLDGYLVCAELRRLYGQTLSIVLITGHDDREAIAAGFAAGADDFISKPIHWTTLGERLRPLFGRQR
jgi:DNA-binding response OmpR family regulator